MSLFQKGAAALTAAMSIRVSSSFFGSSRYTSSATNVAIASTTSVVMTAAFLLPSPTTITTRTRIEQSGRSDVCHHDTFFHRCHFRQSFVERSFSSFVSSCTTLCEQSSSRRPSIPSSLLSKKEEKKREEEEERTYNTPADDYFSKHHKIPLPTTIHATIQPLHRTNSTQQENNKKKKKKKNVLIIGDVHGCLHELQTLHEKAKQEYNDNQPFSYVILVGDLCNKGPQSVGVIQFVRNKMQQNNNNGKQDGDNEEEREDWYAVRGNHDDAALAAALGDEDKLCKNKYKWVTKGDDDMNDEKKEPVLLSDKDVMWLSELPYTITIPHSILSETSFTKEEEDKDEDEVDCIVVHAGLVPGVPLEEQTVEDMITLREVVPQQLPQSQSTLYKAHQKIKKQKHDEKKKSRSTINENNDDVIQLQQQQQQQPVPWASVWDGPQRVVFGHDAKRGLQLQSNNMAIGLDTGACYGKRLSGLILPKRRIVSVESRRVYSPVTGG